MKTRFKGCSGGISAYIGHFWWCGGAAIIVPFCTDQGNADDFAFGTSTLECSKGSESEDLDTETIVETDLRVRQCIMHEAQSPQLGRG